MNELRKTQSGHAGLVREIGSVTGLEGIRMGAGEGYGLGAPRHTRRLTGQADSSNAGPGDGEEDDGQGFLEQESLRRVWGRIEKTIKGKK